MTLTRITIFPTGMRLHEWIAFEEGSFRAEGLDPPFPPERLREAMDAIARWGMGREMQVTEFDELALSLA
jgi:hypothetical protein